MAMPMEQALTPAQVPVMRGFLRALLVCSRQGEVNMTKFIAQYRENMNGYRHKYNAATVGHKTNCLYCGKELTGTAKRQFCDPNCYGKYHRRARCGA